MTDLDLEREALWARYGRPSQFGIDRALHLLGEDPSVTENRIGFRYTCMDEAERYSTLNRERFGHSVIGPRETQDGVIAVLDFGDAVAELRASSRRKEVSDDAA